MNAPKAWPEEFSQDRPFIDNGFFEDRDVLLEKEVDVVDEFFVDFESSIPSWDAAVVRRFRKKHAAFQSNFWGRRRAQLDGRCWDTKLQCHCPDWLSPTELQHHMNAQRFQDREHSNQDVDRQLVYIYRLCPQYIIALIRTAYNHQKAALRSTIWQHIACQASLRVKIPVDGFKTYLLEFHMPFLTLRHAPASSATSDPDTDNADHWPQSFPIMLECDEHERVCKFVVQKFNVSVAVCGWGRKKWTCWAFSNTHSDPTANEEEETDENDMQEDFIATDGNGSADGIVVDANQPIWDARGYWLRVIDPRMRIIYKEWEWLMMNTEAKVKAWRNENPLLFQAKSLGNKQREKAEELLEGTLQVMELLSFLSDVLTMTVRAFIRFKHDKCYFSDIEDAHVASTFDSLQETFGKIVDLQSKLTELEKSCDYIKHIIGLLLTEVGNRLNSETQDHAREAHMVNLATNRVSKSMAVLNRKSTQAAIESSRTTRINVQLFLVTTPFVLALQYFGAEKDIFSFERNPRTFSYAICSLFIALPVLTYILSLLNHRWDVLLSRICGKKATEVNEGDF